MSAHTIAEIFRRVETSKACSTILQVIAYAANVQGQNARIAYSAIALRAGYSERWTITLIQRLEAKHLLRVQRHRLTWAAHDVNRYDLVCPWRRELSYRETLTRKQAAQQASATKTSERIVQGEETKRETKKTTGFCSHEECVAAGLTPGSLAYRLARGLPLEENQDTPGWLIGRKNTAGS